KCRTAGMAGTVVVADSVPVLLEYPDQRRIVPARRGLQFTAGHFFVSGGRQSRSRLPVPARNEPFFQQGRSVALVCAFVFPAHIVHPAGGYGQFVCKKIRMEGAPGQLTLKAWPGAVKHGLYESVVKNQSILTFRQLGRTFTKTFKVS